MTRPDHQHPRVAQAASRPAVGSPPAQTGETSRFGPNGQATWEEFCLGLPPACQSELLSLAGRQGLLYSHQLPTPANGPESDRHVLAQLLPGDTEKLEPVRPGPIEIVDRDLDSIQREAVSRAVQTPDICLLQGPPGSGKSRVV